MRRPVATVLPALTSVLAVMVLGACAGSTTEAVDAAAGDAARGAVLFANNCAACHGPAAEGTENGPSFLSDIYLAGHHGDGSFQVAVQRGVQPHHWTFGPMPAVSGLSADDVTDIVAHVRRLQRAAGVIEGG